MGHQNCCQSCCNHDKLRPVMERRQTVTLMLDYFPIWFSSWELSNAGGLRHSELAIASPYGVSNFCCRDAGPFPLDFRLK